MPSEPFTWQDIRDESTEYIGVDQPPGYPEPVPAPNGLRRGAGAPPAPGTPHATAVRLYLGHIRDDDARLVHGTVLINGERRPYAWIELPGALAWDGGTRRFYDRDAWFAALQPEADQCYTRPEAARLLLVTNHPGPWNE